MQLLQANFSLNKKQYTGATIKANAYGLGDKRIIRTLYKCGCKHFFVATLDEAIELAKHKPEKCIILQRKEHISSLNSNIEISWESAMETANPADCVPVNSNDPLYILNTSGTTGQPKGNSSQV